MAGCGSWSFAGRGPDLLQDLLAISEPVQDGCTRASSPSRTIWRPPSEFQVIGTNTGVASGSTTSVSWSGLAPQTLHEWYVTLNDGMFTTTGPTWDFTTRALAQYALTVTKSGTGSGTVTSTPAGISCGATCSANFTENSQVQLSAVADTGMMFTGWSGACTGSGACTVTMDAAKDVTANLASPRRRPPLTFQEGVSGYAGTQDTYILETSATSSFGTLDTFEWDTEDTRRQLAQVWPAALREHLWQRCGADPGGIDDCFGCPGIHRL